MTFTEFCILFLAFAILALVRILASILQEHRFESATQNADRNAAPPRHPAPNHSTNNPGTSHVRAPAVPPPRPAGLRVRFRSPALPSAQSMTNALLSGIDNLSFPTWQATTAASTSGAHPPAPVAGPSTSRSALSLSTPGPSTSRNSLPAPTAGPSTSRTSLSAPVAGPSTPRRPLTTAAGPSCVPSALFDPTVGASVPWSPKKGWTSTFRANGITYHRTEKKMRPRKSLKASSEEPELVITPYWEPENVAARLLEYPPDLSGDRNLAVGDIFIFHTPTHYRLWIYRAGGHWERIEAGYQREDGRYLIVTPVKKEPSWVSRDYFERQTTRQAEPDSD